MKKLFGLLILTMALVCLFSSCAEIEITINPDGKTCTIVDMNYQAEHLTIPGWVSGLTVTGIGNDVFHGHFNLKTVVIPDSVTHIGINAFASCTSLEIVALPASLESIGQGAFSNCRSLHSITLPDGVTSIGAGAFSVCESITRINIPDGVTDISSRAFSSTSITEIKIPDSVRYIGEAAFSGCEGLTSVKIPDSVGVIDRNAFQYCKGLVNIELGEGVRYIGSEVFAHCDNIRSIHLPASLSEIDPLAFVNCPALSSITVDEDNPYFKSIDGNLYSKDGSTLVRYAVGKNALKIKVIDGVKTIGKAAFYGSLISTVIFPEGLEAIEEMAFALSSRLTKLVIPDSIVTIDRTAFPPDYYSNSYTIYYRGSEESWNSKEGIDLGEMRMIFNHKGDQ